MKNRFNITESEKNRIRSLHNNYSIIKEDTYTDNKDIINACLGTVSGKALFDEDFIMPFSCVQLMISGGKEKYHTPCWEKVEDIMLGDDNEKGEELFNFVRKHGRDLIKCVEERGVDITDELIDRIEDIDLTSFVNK